MFVMFLLLLLLVLLLLVRHWRIYCKNPAVSIKVLSIWHIGSTEYLPFFPYKCGKYSGWEGAIGRLGTGSEYFPPLHVKNGKYSEIIILVGLSVIYFLSSFYHETICLKARQILPLGVFLTSLGVFLTFL